MRPGFTWVSIRRYNATLKVTKFISQATAGKTTTYPTELDEDIIELRLIRYTFKDTFRVSCNLSNFIFIHQFQFLRILSL
jgi:hypothetical protein